MAWNANEPGNYAWLAMKASQNGGVTEFCKKVYEDGIKEGIKIGSRSKIPAFALGALAGAAICGAVCYYLGKRKRRQEVSEETVEHGDENVYFDGTETSEDWKNGYHEECMDELKSDLSFFCRTNNDIRCLTDVKLSVDNEECEIDAVAFTPKGVCVMENNRSTKDSFLCGQEEDDDDYSIDRKMELSERLLRKILTKNDRELKIDKVVLFRSPYLDVNYESEDIKGIPFNCLTDYLNEGGFPRYTSYDVHEMYELVRMSNQRKVV